MEHRKQDLMEANTRVVRRQETEQEGKLGMVDSDPLLRVHRVGFTFINLPKAFPNLDD